MLPIKATPEHLQALSRASFPFLCRGAMQTLLPATPILWNWHLDLIANKLEDVMAGRVRRLIINIPPRYGKSLIASVSFPAFILGHRPTAEVVCISYSADLAEKMAGDTRRLMNSGYYHGLFGQRLTSSRSRLGELKTPEGGGRLATSVEGTITGRGGNFIIIDDPLRPADARSDVKRQGVNDWFDSTIVSRPNNKETDAIIVIMQRLHEDDLVGHLIAQGHWEVLSLPLIAEEDEVHELRTPFGIQITRRLEGEALHPARESLASIAEMRATMSAYDFSAQCQQRPAPAGGGIVKTEWFSRYDRTTPPKFVRVFQSWNCAAKTKQINDFSVCTTWGITYQKNIYLLHVLRARLEYPELKRKLRELAEEFCAGVVLIEDSSAGIQLIQEFCREGFARIIAIKPKGEKVTRMMAQTPMMEAGRVYIPHDAPWLNDYLHELAMFPMGRTDDQVDSTAQALAHISMPSKNEGFLEYMRSDTLRRHGLTPEDLVITFDYMHGNSEFDSCTRRTVRRENDGFYHCSRLEWEGLRYVPGMVLIADDGAAKD